MILPNVFNQSQLSLIKITDLPKFQTLEFPLRSNVIQTIFMFLHFEMVYVFQSQFQVFNPTKELGNYWFCTTTEICLIISYNQQFYYTQTKLLMENSAEIVENYVNSSFDSEQDSLQYVEDFTKQKNKSATFSQDLANLQKAKEHFKQFVQSIGELKKTSIRQDILKYLQGNKKGDDKSTQAFYQPDALLKKIQVRIEKMIKTKRIKRNWGDQDFKILVWVISKYCELKGLQDLAKDITEQDWKMIASVIPGATSQSCMFKWLSVKKVTLANHSWTNQESTLLTDIVNRKLNMQGEDTEIKDWKEISQDLYRLNPAQIKVYRNAKQCRQHWTCYLSPQLKKGPWQVSQDMKLLTFIKDNKGLKKWSQIAKKFEGRTQNALKNRYTLLMDKIRRRPKNKGKSQLQLISQHLQKYYLDQLTCKIKEQEQNKLEEAQVDRSNDVTQPKTKCLNKRDQYTSLDTNDLIAAPLRVQHVSISDFQLKNLQFFKNMQPGVMSAGTFKKISSSCKYQTEKANITNNLEAFEPYKTQKLAK